MFAFGTKKRQFRLKFRNSTDAPLSIQVDPWASLYVLNKGERIELVVDISKCENGIEIDKHSDQYWIVELTHYREYFIVRNGDLVHWTDYQTNVND